MQGQNLGQMLDTHPSFRLPKRSPTTVAHEFFVPFHHLGRTEVLDAAGDTGVLLHFQVQVQERFFSPADTLAEQAPGFIDQVSLEEVVHPSAFFCFFFSSITVLLLILFVFFLQDVAQFVEQEVQKLVGVLMQVATEHLVVFLQSVDEFFGSQNACFFLLLCDLQEELVQAGQQVLFAIAISCRTVFEQLLPKRHAGVQRLQHRVAVARVPVVLQSEDALVVWHQAQRALQTRRRGAHRARLDTRPHPPSLSSPDRTRCSSNSNTIEPENRPLGVSNGLFAPMDWTRCQVQNRRRAGSKGRRGRNRRSTPFRAQHAKRFDSFSRERSRQIACEERTTESFEGLHAYMAAATCVVGAASAILAMTMNKGGRLDGEDAHVVITGGSSGIGKAMAVEMARLGAQVTVVARGAEALARVVDEVPNGDNLHVEVADVADFGAVQAAFRRARNKFGPVTMLVCAAGFAAPSRFVDAPVDDAHAMVQANYLGALHASKAAYEDVEAAGKRGRIMLVASQAAQVGVFGMAAYSGTKWALRGFAEALAMELAPSGARVCVAFPPDTDTPGFANEEIGKPEETRYITGSDKPWKPEDVARRLVKGLLRGDFQVSCGLEGWALATLTCGFAPPNSLLGALGEVFLLGILRVVALVLRATWTRKVKQMSATEKATG